MNISNGTENTSKVLDNFLKAQITFRDSEKQLREELEKIDENIADLNKVRESIIEALSNTVSGAQNSPVQALEPQNSKVVADETLESVVEASETATVNRKSKKSELKTSENSKNKEKEQSEWGDLLDSIDVDEDTGNDLDDIQF